MKRTLAYLTLIISLVLASCLKTGEDEHSFSQHPLSINEARISYNADHRHRLRLIGDSYATTRTDNHPLSNIEPDWSKAQYSDLLGEEVVEVPFDGVSAAIKLGDISGNGEEHYHTAPPSNTAIRLVAALDYDGNIYYCVFHITSDKTAIEKLGIESLDSNFSGILKRFLISGEFYDGYVIENGHIVQTISPSSDINYVGRCSYSAQNSIETCETITETTWIKYPCMTEGSGSINWEILEGEIDVVGICYEKIVDSYKICFISGGGDGEITLPPLHPGGFPDRDEHHSAILNLQVNANATLGQNFGITTSLQTTGISNSQLSCYPYRRW